METEGNNQEEVNFTIISFIVFDTCYVHFCGIRMEEVPKRSRLYLYSLLDAKFMNMVINENIAAAISANIRMSVKP